MSTSPNKTKYPKQLFNIVLVEPEIPSNTGNIGRTCVGCWAKLHLIKPLGFEITDKQLRRAGLDYWPHLELEIHDSWQDYWAGVEDKKRVFFLSTKGKKYTFEGEFKEGDTFVFGKETKGLDETLLSEYSDQVFKLPILGKIRSYNLSNSVAMVLSEGIRQVSRQTPLEELS